MADNNPFSYLKKLLVKHGIEKWSVYDTVIRNTLDAERKLIDAIQSSNADTGSSAALIPPDASLVVSGSFARYEMTEGSDVDWCLLIDGVVDNQHPSLASIIKEAIKQTPLSDPGNSGVFGNLVFSHNLVHHIGGGADSNRNLTQRMLMLIESRCLPFDGDTPDTSVWENVLKNICERYFEEDVHFKATEEGQVPRFLLNDITRYWRTICVDYAAKHKEQGEHKWAIRNAKLRTSRKLLYAAGLAFCLKCKLSPPTPEKCNNLFGGYVSVSKQNFIDEAMKFARTPPLEYIAIFIADLVHDDSTQKTITELLFGSYADWLSLLNDGGKRNKLKELTHQNSPEDDVFNEVCSMGTRFAQGLELLFFGFDREQKATNDNLIAHLCLQYVGF